MENLSYNVIFQEEINSFVKFYQDFYEKNLRSNPNAKITRRAGINYASLKILIMQDVEKLSSSNQKKFYNWVQTFMQKDRQIQEIVYKKKKSNLKTILNFNIYLMSLQIMTLQIFLKKNKLSTEQILNNFLDSYKNKLESVSSSFGIENFDEP